MARLLYLGGFAIAKNPVLSVINANSLCNLAAIWFTQPWSKISFSGTSEISGRLTLLSTEYAEVTLRWPSQKHNLQGRTKGQPYHANQQPQKHTSPESTLSLESSLMNPANALLPHS